MAPKDEIAPPHFRVEHPELYHYTDFRGLSGIIQSNALWATHFRHLNDFKEVILLKQEMGKLLMPRIVKANTSMAESGNRRTRRALTSRGNLAGIGHVLRVVLDALFQIAFGGGPTEPLAEPYITSFCTHSLAHPYERQHGLLSQWRAYGGGERYCIVFDTAEIINLLNDEFSNHYYTYMYLNRVNYNNPEIDMKKLFPEFFKICENYLLKKIQGCDERIAPEIATLILEAAPWLKHQGFTEEQEVRVVAIPGIKSLADKAALDDWNQKPLPLKRTLSRITLSGSCPYVALFDGLGAKLPIKQVIVGPSANQRENAARARRLLGKRFPISLSETPFIG